LVFVVVSVLDVFVVSDDDKFVVLWLSPTLDLLLDELVVLLLLSVSEFDLVEFSDEFSVEVSLVLTVLVVDELSLPLCVDDELAMEPPVAVAPESAAAKAAPDTAIPIARQEAVTSNLYRIVCLSLNSS
jgi:hypothetical protein